MATAPRRSALERPASRLPNRRTPKKSGDKSPQQSRLLASHSIENHPAVGQPQTVQTPRRQRLMIVLHGRGDSLGSFINIKNELRLPGMNYLLLNAPRRSGQGYSWYALEPRHETGILRARALLFALVDQLKVAGWKTEDIFFLGHSQGALVVSDFLMNHPDRFGGVVGVSGYIWFPRGWKARVRRAAAQVTPWLMTYGKYDRIIPPNEIREDLDQLWAEGLMVTAHAFSKGHDFDFQKEVPFMRRWLRQQISR